MTLTKFERLSFYNQYEILAALADNEYDKERYTKQAEIFFYGYEFEYEDLISGMGEELPSEKSRFVINVLDMYRTLYDSYQQLSDTETQEIDDTDIKFAGFDQQNELELYGYAKFLVETKGAFTEVQEYNKSLNSHGLGPSISKLHEMIQKLDEINNERFKEHPARRFLTVEEIQEITK